MHLALFISLKSLFMDKEQYLTRVQKKKKTQNTQRKKRNTQMPPQFGIKLIKSLIIYHSNALKPQGQLLQFINFYCLNAFMHSL